MILGFNRSEAYLLFVNYISPILSKSLPSATAVATSIGSTVNCIPASDLKTIEAGNGQLIDIPYIQAMGHNYFV